MERKKRNKRRDSEGLAWQPPAPPKPRPKPKPDDAKFYFEDLGKPEKKVRRDN